MAGESGSEKKVQGYRRLSRRSLIAGLAAAAAIPTSAQASRDTRPCHPPRYLKWTAARERRWPDDIGGAGFVNYYGNPVHFDEKINLVPESLPSCLIWGATQSSLERPGPVRDNLKGASLFGAPSSTDCQAWPTESQMHYERRVADLVGEIAAKAPAPNAARPVRFCAVGSTHSSSDVYKRLPDGQAVVLHVEGLNHLLLSQEGWKSDFLARHPDRGFATVGAGITICQLNETLWSEGLAIETQGSFDGQTLAGAISTATHGAGVGEGSVSDSVQAVILVAFVPGENNGPPSWQVLQVEPDPDEAITDPAMFRAERGGIRWRLVQDSALFDAVVVSMGTMGIIAGFIMRVKKAYYLHELRVGRSWSEVKRNLVERATQPPIGFANEGWRYELVVNANAVRGSQEWATTEVYRDAWKYDLNYREDIREIPQKWAGGLARNVNLGGNLGNTISSLADKALVRGQRVGSFADRCYRVLKLGQGEFVQAWGTELMVRAENGAALIDWILRTNPTCGDLKRYQPRNHRLVNPFGVRFATGRRGFLAPVRWRDNGKPATVCTVELTEAVKNNRERNLGPREQDKPASREVVARWADMFTKEFGSDGRLHWGQVQGSYDGDDLAKAYPKEEIDAWFEAFRLMNAFGYFDTSFARRLGFIDRREASRSLPLPTYRGLGRPLVEAPITVVPTPSPTVDGVEGEGETPANQP